LHSQIILLNDYYMIGFFYEPKKTYPARRLENNTHIFFNLRCAIILIITLLDFLGICPNQNMNLF